MKAQRSIPLAAAGVALALAATAAPAGAHTSATCVLDRAQANCVGNIIYQVVDPMPSAASLTINGSTGHMWIGAYRLLSLFDKSMTIEADLNCVRASSSTTCSGQSETAGLPIKVRTSGDADGSHALVSLSDGIDLPEAIAPVTTAPPTHVKKARRHHSKLRRHARHAHAGHRSR